VNDWTEETSFFDAVCFGDLVEHVAQSLDKGCRFICSDRLSQSSWETAEGQKRSKIKIVIDSIGPDLRFANCEVERIERTTPDTGRTANSDRAGAALEEPF
jgi:single-strand DNA-binding protein